MYRPAQLSLVCQKINCTVYVDAGRSCHTEREREREKERGKRENIDTGLVSCITKILFSSNKFASMIKTL